MQDGWVAAEDVGAAQQRQQDAGDAVVVLVGAGGAVAEAWRVEHLGLLGAQEAWVVALLLLLLREWRRCCWHCAWGDVVAALHR